MQQPRVKILDGSIELDMSTILPTLKDPGTRVLIVDDSEQYAQVLTRLLGGVFGYKDIRSVSSTDLGYETLAADQGIRLVFIDYNFPDGKTGGALLVKLSEAGLLKDRVVFLITSDPNIKIMDEATKAGAFGVVAKPFNRGELQRQIDRAEHFLFADSLEYI